MSINVEELIEKFKEANKESNIQLMAEIDGKLKALQTVDPGKRPENETKQKPVWKSFGELLQVVAKVETEHKMDPRLVYEKQQGMSEGVGADGGFFVVPEFSEQLLIQTYETGILTRDCWKIPMSSNRLVMNAVDETSRVTGSRGGGLLTYWSCEAGTKLSSHPKLRQIILGLNKHIGAYYATDELLEDAAALEAVVSKLFAQEFGWRIDDSILNGTGAGMPLGILQGGGLVTQPAEALQPADTVVAENIIGMWNLMPAANRAKAKWYINQDVEPQLMQMYIPAGLGGLPVYLPAGGFVSAPNGTLLGRPIQPIEQCAALGNVGDIVFADMSQYALGEKSGGIQAASSIHVAFMTDEQVFRFVLRMDGQPLWNHGVLAADAVTTRSPYVTLAARP